MFSMTKSRELDKVQFHYGGHYGEDVKFYPSANYRDTAPRP